MISTRLECAQCNCVTIYHLYPPLTMGDAIEYSAYALQEIKKLKMQVANRNMIIEEFERNQQVLKKHLNKMMAER